MDRLWTDGPPTQTYTPPRPPYAEMPAAPPPPPPRGRSPWLAALGGGTVSAVLVAAVLLGTGAAGDSDTPASSGTQTPVSISASDGKGNLVRTIYAAASPSVVSVRTGEGSGTGFLVDSDGTIVTNAHVVGDNSDVQVRFEDDGELHDARVLGVDASTDLAALKVDASAANGVKPLALADSDNVQVGDTALAIGYPLGLDRTATAGIVSGLERDIQAPNGFSIDKVIQTDAPINPGNSGGPLLNASGQVIGVNSQIATAGGGNGSVGIGFAVPANTVKEVLPQLERGAAPEHAYLGVSTGAAPNGGAQVGEATADGPAAKAGIQAGDVITEVNGDRVQDPDDVAQAIEDKKPGDEVDVKVQRGGSEQTIQVTLGQRPEQLPLSFQAPAFLIALALVPLAAIAYAVAQRRRRAAAAAFARPAVRASALPRTPGWRRHAPVALYGAALAALAVALARPEATVAVPTEQASVVLAIDRSGSMRATDVAPSRLAAMKSAAARFLDRVPRRVKVGAVTFNGRTAVLEAPTTDRAPVKAAIDSIEAKGGTASGDGLAAALDLIRRGAERPPAAVVLISDGKSTRGADPVEVAREAAELGVPVYTVALGTPDGTVVDAEGVTHEAAPDPEAMRAVAEASGGRSFTVEDADRLDAIYERLGSQVATERERREITAAFAGGALLFVAGGALLSLHWFRRLV